MAKNLLHLYPGPTHEIPLRGSYLDHAVHRLGGAERPFVYANFVSSLDGRIAIGEGQQSRLPVELNSGNDFRLFLELQAQADCLITHGGYMRAIAEGRLDDILQVGTRAGTEDLAAWRNAQGLTAQPAVVIASGSLDFTVPASIAAHGQRLFVATGTAADTTRVAALQQRGIEVIFAGAGKAVEGRALAQAMAERGFMRQYLLAGPRMLETMLRQKMLCRLYLTLTHQLLGGDHFHSLIDGPVLGGEGRLQLRSLRLDALSHGGAGQLFAMYEPHG